MMQNDGSLLLDDGTVKICNLQSVTVPGSMPVEKLVEVIEQYFGEKQIGITRQYLAKGADEQVDMLIEIWDEGTRPQIGQYAYIEETEEQFRIDNVQPLLNKNNLKVIDLTLSRLENYYDINWEA